MARFKDEIPNGKFDNLFKKIGTEADTPPSPPPPTPSFLEKHWGIIPLILALILITITLTAGAGDKMDTIRNTKKKHLLVAAIKNAVLFSAVFLLSGFVMVKVFDLPNDDKVSFWILGLSLATLIVFVWKRVAKRYL